MAEKLDYRDYRGAVFDFDGTIIHSTGKDGLRLHSGSRLEAFRQVGLELESQPLQTVSQELNDAAYENAPAATLEATVWWMLKELGEVGADDNFDAGHPLVAAIVAHKNRNYPEHMLLHGVEVPGVSSFISRVATRGYAGRLAIASTAPLAEIEAFLPKLKLHRYFSPGRIISKEKVASPKPDPEAYVLAAGTIPAYAEDDRPLIAFDDDPRGVESAKRAGLFVCGVATRFSEGALNSAAFQPDVIVEDFKEAAQLFSIDIKKLI